MSGSGRRTYGGDYSGSAVTDSLTNRLNATIRLQLPGFDRADELGIKPYPRLDGVRLSDVDMAVLIDEFCVCLNPDERQLV